MRNKVKIKEYCKYMKLKLVKYNESGFIGSSSHPIRAGMEHIPGNGNIISFPIRTIGHKKIYRQYLCLTDGDIVDNGKVNRIKSIFVAY